MKKSTCNMSISYIFGKAFQSSSDRSWMIVELVPIFHSRMFIVIYIYMDVSPRQNFERSVCRAVSFVEPHTICCFTENMGCIKSKNFSEEPKELKENRVRKSEPTIYVRDPTSNIHMPVSREVKGKPHCAKLGLCMTDLLKHPLTQSQTYVLKLLILILVTN